MNGAQFGKIRKSLGLTQEELAGVLWFSGKKAVSNIERGVRKPGPLVAALMNVFSELPQKRAKELQEMLLVSGKRRRSSRRAADK